MRCAAAIALIATASAAAQDFTAVPTVVTASPESFATLFSSARRQQLHAVIIGDSQETCSLGAGLEYIPAFNAAWAERAGGCAMTPLVQPGQNFPSPAGEWLVRGQILHPAVADPSPMIAADALPGLANWPLPAPTTGQRGWFALLQPNATSVSASLAIDRTRAWFDTSQGVYIDVYTLADPLYGNVQARWSLAPGSAPNAAATVLGQGVTHAAVGGPPVARSTFGPVTWSPSPDACLQVELVGADPGKPARLVSVGFRAVANPVGIAVTDIAGGGHNASSLLSEHVAAMDHLTSLGVDCVFISLGANDAWTSPDVYKQRLTALIAAVRQRTHPELPVIILGDPYRRGLTTVALDWLDHFPRAAADLAQELPSVCAVNSRRLTHDAGWTPDSGSAYLVDGVHYNPTGATLKAAAEVGALWGSFVCPADVGVQGGLPGRDGGLDNNDFVAFIDAFFARHPIADFGRQGGLPLSDGRFDNNDFVVFIDSYFAGCP